jgi:hypothetical protein
MIQNNPDTTCDKLYAVSVAITKKSEGRIGRRILLLSIVPYTFR